MRAIKVIILLTCTGLAGCNKPAESQERVSTPVKTAPAKADNRPIIVALGDSLSEGLGVEPGNSFPDQVQRKLDSSGYKYRVINLGISGDTTTGGVGRLDYVLSLKPAVVILELGGNDGLRGVPISSTKANLAEMIVKLRKNNADVLLAGMTLPPNYGPEYIRKFEQVYTELAQTYKLPLIPFLMEDIRAQLASKPGLMQRDGIHPTAAGHALIAETVFRYLRPMLKAP